MPNYIPSKTEQFEELLNNLLVRLVELIGDKHPDEPLDDEAITATLILLRLPLFRGFDLGERGINKLNELGVSLDKIHDVYQPLIEFIQNNEDIKVDLLKIYSAKVDEYHKQILPELRGGKRRKLTRKHTKNSRKTKHGGWHNILKPEHFEIVTANFYEGPQNQRVINMLEGDLRYVNMIDDDHRGKMFSVEYMSTNSGSVTIEPSKLEIYKDFDPMIDGVKKYTSYSARIEADSKLETPITISISSPNNSIRTVVIPVGTIVKMFAAPSLRDYKLLVFDRHTGSTGGRQKYNHRTRKMRRRVRKGRKN